MSERPVTTWRDKARQGDVKFYEADDFGHDEKTPKHDQLISMQKQPNQQGPSTRTQREHPNESNLEWPWVNPSATMPKTGPHEWAKPAKMSTPSSPTSWPYRAREPRSTASSSSKASPLLQVDWPNKAPGPDTQQPSTDMPPPPSWKQKRAYLSSETDIRSPSSATASTSLGESWPYRPPGPDGAGASSNIQMPLSAKDWLYKAPEPDIPGASTDMPPPTPWKQDRGYRSSEADVQPPTSTTSESSSLRKSWPYQPPGADVTGASSDMPISISPGDKPHGNPEIDAPRSPDHTSSKALSSPHRPASSGKSFPGPYPAAISTAVAPEKEPHMDTPHAATFFTPYQDSTSSTEESESRPQSMGSTDSKSSEETISATTDAPSSLDDGTSEATTEASSKKPQVSILLPFTDLFKPPVNRSPHESPISPLTIREQFPPSPSEASSVVRFDSRSLIAPSPLSIEQQEPDLEGVSLQMRPFARPLSQRSSSASTTSSRRTPGLLTPLPGAQTVVPRLFLDPLGPQKEDQFHLGLPSLRHILDGPETPAASDGAVKPPPDVSQDHAIVNRLEALQRDATECWAKSATALNADEKAVLNDTVGTLWHTAVSLVAELLRSHKKLRQAGNLHRGSLGEIDRLRKHSEDQEGRVVEQKEAASVEIQELRRENVFLHQQLAMRDLESRSGDEPSPEAKSLAMGTWVAKQPFLPNSSTQGARPAALLQALEEEEEVQPEAQPGQMASVAKLLDWPAIHPAPKERPWEDDVHSQRLWQPDPKSSPELEQKISQLRDRLAHEVFEKEVLRERLEQLEREVALLHAFEVVDEPSDADSMAEAATKRLAELVGVRAALKTAQQSYESDKGYYASIQGRCDELEGRLEERDGVVEKLGRELKEVQAELQEERRELNEARFEAEEREGVVEDLKGQVMAMAKEVARAEVEMDMLVGELKATQAELAHARNKIQKLEDDLYDRDTRIGELIQDLDYERNERARAEAEFRVIKVELSSSVDALAEQCAAQERQIEDYKRTITQHEAVVAQLEQDYDLLNNHFMDEGVKRLDLAEQVKAQQVKITQLMRELRSYADINKRLAQHLKSLGQEEGWQRLEELRLRCEKLEEHRAAFAPTIFDLAREKERAQLRYEHDHRALAGAQADLKKLRQQRGYDIKRQTQLLARIAYLEQAYERAKHALQIAQLRLAGAKQIDGAHAREIEDLEAILRAMRGQETDKEKSVGLSQTYLPSPPVIREKVVSRAVEHYHSKACFCSLVEYWFPGALETVLPRKDAEDDFDYDYERDVYDEYSDDGQALDSIPVTEEDDFLSNDISASDYGQVSSDEVKSVRRAAWEDYLAQTATHDDRKTVKEPQELDDTPLNLRGGAGEPSSPKSEKSAGFEEKMAAFTTTRELDDWRGEGSSGQDNTAEDTFSEPPEEGFDAGLHNDNSLIAVPGSTLVDEDIDTGTDSEGSSDDPDDEEDWDLYSDNVQTPQSAEATAGPSTATLPHSDIAGTQSPDEGDETVVRGRHTTRAGERIDVKRKAGGGFKLTIRTPTAQSSVMSASLPQIAREQLARASDECPTLKEEEVAQGLSAGSSEREELSAEESSSDESSKDLSEEGDAHEEGEVVAEREEGRSGDGESDDEDSDAGESDEGGSDAGDSVEEEADEGQDAQEEPEEVVQEERAQELGVDEPESESQESTEIPHFESDSYRATEDKQINDEAPQGAVISNEASLGAKCLHEPSRQEDAACEETVPGKSIETPGKHEDLVKAEAPHLDPSGKARISPPPVTPPSRQIYPPSPRDRRGISTPIPSPSGPTASLLARLNDDLRVPSVNSSPSSPGRPRRPRRPNYHGHSRSYDGPVTSPGHFLCQLLTALTWLGLLILSQPSNLGTTVAILAGYFFVPFYYITRLSIYYIVVLPNHYTKTFLVRLLPHLYRDLDPDITYPVRPMRPALGRVSAAAIVSSVVSLAVVFLFIALDAVRHEREIWVGANRWTAAYVRDLVDGDGRYPWWSPVDVDFRLSAMEWFRWKGNVWALGKRYCQTW